MNETSRAAALDEAGVVVNLMREGRAGLRDARGGGLWLDRQALQEPLEPLVDSLLEDNQWLIQLALIDAVPLGVLVAEQETISATPVAVVHEVFVVDAARGIGLGELMMDATVTWATEHDCIGVDGYALPGDRATKNFFETFGLVARGIVVHRSIS